VNLSPARLAVIVALVVGGVAVLLNGFSGSGGASAVGEGGTPPTAAASSPTTTSSPTETPSKPVETPAPVVDGVTVMVFNGTNTTGLGAQVDELLTGKGYDTPVVPGNAPSKPVDKTIVYFRGGPDADQNESNATHMSKRFLGGTDVKPLGAEFESLVPTTTQLVVVVGEDYPDAT
jgi:hypothetical protein